MLGHKKEENKAQKDNSGSKQAPLSTTDDKHTFRADLGEGLPDQKDNLNPDRAK